MTVAAAADVDFPQLVACSRLVGQKFCDALVGALAETLGVPTVLLARVDPENPGRARAVSAWSNGALVPALAYDLVGSPCRDVMMGGTCHFADNVVARFPEDALLREMGARGYVGAPLVNHDGRAVGVLAAISGEPIEPSPIVLSLFEIFASRAAAELEREASISRSAYLGQLIDGSANEIYVFDAETLHFVLVNQGARENLGYSLAELAQLTPLDLKPELTRQELLALLAPLRSRSKTVVSFRTLHRRKDGTRYLAAIRVQLISDFGAPVYFAAIEDISQRAAVEAKLSEAQRRLQRLFAQSPAGVVEADATGRMTLVNPAWCDMLGYTEAELHERTIFDLTHPDSMPRTRAAIAELLAGAQGVVVEKNYVRKDGRILNAMSNVSALRDDEGAFLGVAAVVTDVTERLQAEERIRDSEARLRKILDGTLAFVGLLQPDGTLLEANAPALAAAGLSREAVIGKKFWECYWWSHDPAVVQRLKEAVTRAAAGSVVRYDEAIRIKDDGRITIDFLLTPYYADDGSLELLVPSGVDVTERTRQAALLQDLIHEVNHRTKNILAVVQAIARQMPETAPADFKRELGRRLKSLAACQDILVNNDWQDVPIDALIRAQLTHFTQPLDRRIALQGPLLKVSPATSQVLGMAVYELATNAIKYGSLSNLCGTVDIRWRVENDDVAPRFRLLWQERGGPPVRKPATSGFGSKVLSHLVAQALSGASKSTYEPAGFEWQFDCGLQDLQRNRGR